MKRIWAWLLCACMLPGVAMAMEGAYLSGEDLQGLEPAFEEFVEALSEVLVDKGLLQESEREEWILYQLGDYLQNGGFGTIAVMYTPGLLGIANEAVTLRRFSVQSGPGTIWVETLRRFSEGYSSLPGLPLDTEMQDLDGDPIAGRFRWTASEGAFLIWDGTLEEVVDVGATYISDGRPLYWYAEPYEGTEVTLTLEVLYENEDATMASATLSLLSGEDFWAPEVLK